MTKMTICWCRRRLLIRQYIGHDDDDNHGWLWYRYTDICTKIIVKHFRRPLTTAGLSGLSTRLPIPLGGNHQNKLNCRNQQYIPYSNISPLSLYNSVPGRQTTQTTTAWPFMGLVPRYDEWLIILVMKLLWWPSFFLSAVFQGARRWTWCAERWRKQTWCPVRRKPGDL